MNCTTFPRIVILFFMTCFAHSISAQEAKEATILYNSKWVKAMISPTGDVISIIGEEPDLAGFTLKIQDYGQFLDQTTEAKGTECSPIQTESNNKDYLLVNFEPNYATLSDDAVTSLNLVVDKLKSGMASKINIETLGKIDFETVNQNRINSIRTYLKIRGIDPSKVNFKSLIGQKNVDEVKIYFAK